MIGIGTVANKTSVNMVNAASGSDLVIEECQNSRWRLTCIDKCEVDEKRDRVAFGALDGVIPVRAHGLAEKKEGHGAHEAVSAYKRCGLRRALSATPAPDKHLHSNLPMVSRRHQTYQRPGLRRTKLNATDDLRRAMPRHDEMMTCQKVVLLSSV